MIKGISKSEFARREGCDESLVRKKIKSGHLKTLSTGKLDPALIGTPWRRGNETNTLEHQAQAQIDAATAAGKIPPKGVSEARKEHYNALLKQLEYDLKTGEIVVIEDVVTEVGVQFARVRTKMLGIGSRLAPRLAAVNTVSEAEALLMDEIQLVVQEMTLDGGGLVPPAYLIEPLRIRFGQRAA